MVMPSAKMVAQNPAGNVKPLSSFELCTRWIRARQAHGEQLADDAYGEGDALVEGLAGDSMGADDVAEFVLWVTLGGWGDSFV